MIITKLMNEALANVDNVLDADQPKAVTAADLHIANAYIENKAAEKHVQDVNNDLQKAAKVVTPSTKTTEKTTVNNVFTTTGALEEDVTPVKVDGRANKVIEKEDTTVLDYDMFDFIYGLVTSSEIRPKNPVSMKPRTFLYVGNDKYKPSSNEVSDLSDGHNQVGTSGNTIDLYSNDETAFDWITEVCKKYKFRYEGPRDAKSTACYWSKVFTIYVPTVSNGYPYMIEDYFETLGLTMEDVMPKAFCDAYRKCQNALQAEIKLLQDARVVKQKVSAAIRKAALDSEPLKKHLEALYAELDAANLTYLQTDVRRMLYNAFKF